MNTKKVIGNIFNRNKYNTVYKRTHDKSFVETLFLPVSQHIPKQYPQPKKTSCPSKKRKNGYTKYIEKGNIIPIVLLCNHHPHHCQERRYSKIHQQCFSFCEIHVRKKQKIYSNHYTVWSKQTKQQACHNNKHHIHNIQFFLIRNIHNSIITYFRFFRNGFFLFFFFSNAALL